MSDIWLQMIPPVMFMGFLYKNNIYLPVLYLQRWRIAVQTMETKVFLSI